MLEHINLAELNISTEKVRDWIFHHDMLIILFHDRFVQYNLNGKLIKSYLLIYDKSEVKVLNLDQFDQSYLYIGYSDGVMEIWNYKLKISFSKLTSKDDAGGPGSPEIIHIFGSNHYVCVNTTENGILIYAKPTFLLHKWVMVGSYTTINAFTIHHQNLFALEENHHLHRLDFNKQLLIEQSLNSFKIVDVEFDGVRLYVITDHFLDVYNLNQQKISKKQLSFNGTRLTDLIHFEKYLIVLIDDYSFYILNKSNLKIINQYSLGKSKYIQIFSKLKYNQYSIIEDNGNLNLFYLSKLGNAAYEISKTVIRID